MKNRKILFFDIDGTLLSHRTLQIPESAKRAIRKAKEKGHLVFINTGRTISVVNKEIKELGFDGYICGCGSYIEVDGEVIYSNDIDKSKYTAAVDKYWKLLGIKEKGTACQAVFNEMNKMLWHHTQE